MSGWTLNKVLADGCFDPLHIGHLRYLSAAAGLGDLYVHIAPDEAIRAKGREPFQTRGERVQTVSSLCIISQIMECPTLAEAIETCRPQYLAKGVEWAGKLPTDVIAACRAMGTVILYVDTQERTSTERLG